MKRVNTRLENLPQSIWETIAKIDELKGRWVGGAELNPQVLGRLKKSTLITSTGASTRIEGGRLSDEDVEKLMKGLSIQKFTDRDKQEVRGYYELLDNVFGAWKHIPFSESTILHFHKELLKYVEKDELHRGQYKKIENKVHMIDEAGNSIGILFDTTPAYLTSKEMSELVDWTKENLELTKISHPILIMANFLVEFLNIHPFQDGNGRLSRILANLMMLRAGYTYVPYISHEKLVEDNKMDYYMALRRSQKTFKSEKETIVPWLEFLLNILLKQAGMAIDLLSKESIELLLSPKQLQVWSYLQTVAEATPGEISKRANVSRPTVSQALGVLLRLKKIKRIGQGRTTRYSRL
ncbi:MAG: Fic family protein [bacterium]|nr:Fic family protein [bacterium]